MTNSTNTPHLAIVGAGVLGLAHAVEALDRGYRVTVLEQDSQARAASVQNFGHLCFSAQAGQLGALAQAAAPRWNHIAARAGLTTRASGTLAVARTEAEVAALHTAARQDDGFTRTLLNGSDTAAHLGVPEAQAPLAGLFMPEDLTVNPREVVAALATWVAAHERGRVRFRTHVTGVSQRGDTATVHTSRGPVDADHVIVTVGHLTGRLFPEIADTHRLEECALQMLRVRAPHTLPLGPAVLTGTSMLRYGAFIGAATKPLRTELAATQPHLLDMQANLMFTHHPDGTLLLGDTHRYAPSVDPFLSEAWSRAMLEAAAALLGVPELTVLERWQGVYAANPDSGILTVTPDPLTTVVTLTTGVGMTTSFGIAVSTINNL